MAYSVLVTTKGASPVLVTAQTVDSIDAVVGVIHAYMPAGAIARAVVTGPDNSGAIVVHEHDGWVVRAIETAANRTVLELRARLTSTRSTP